MASNVSRGADAKGRTKRWLERRGYQVADLEVVRWVWRGGKPAFAVKKDQFGSDLLAVGHGVVVFVQVKSGKQCIGAGSFPAARRALMAFEHAPGVRKLIVAWAPGATMPRLIKCFSDESWCEVPATAEVKA